MIKCYSNYLWESFVKYKRSTKIDSCFKIEIKVAFPFIAMFQIMKCLLNTNWIVSVTTMNVKVFFLNKKSDPEGLKRMI